MIATDRTERRERWKLIQQLAEEAKDETQLEREAAVGFDRVVANEVRFRIGELCEDYFNFTLQPFHVEILEKMFDGGRCVVNLPSDHGKSTVATFLFPLLSLMEDPNETHIICGANINDSKRRVAALQREIETNTRLTEDYPWIAKPENHKGRIWSTLQFNVSGRTMNKPNPSVLAGAVGSADIRGRRGKLLMDDIEGEEARNSPMERRRLYDFVKLEAVRCYEDKRDSPRPLLMALGTPFDVDSLYFKLQDEGWEVIRYPVFTTESGDNHNADLWHVKWLWEEKADKVRYMRDALNAQQFSVMYLMDPTGGDTSVLSYNEMRRLAMRAIFDSPEYLTFISLDPASGQTNARSDYCGVMVARIHWEGGEDELPQVEILKALRITEGLFEQVHIVAALAHEFQCPIVYEANSQQGGTYANAFRHLHPEVKLVRHYTTNVTKFDNKMGLTVLKTLMRMERLRIMESQLESEGFKWFLAELRDLGTPGSHDHLSAALWFIVRLAYESVRYHRGSALQSGYVPRRIGVGGSFFGGQPAIAAYRSFGFNQRKKSRPEDARGYR